VVTAAQYAANYDSGQAAGQTAGRALGQADVTNAPNTHGLYNLSQVQALNVDAPLLTREAGNNKFKLTIKVKKSTDLKTFSAFPFVFENSTINANGEMEFQFTSTENAAFYRLRRVNRSNQSRHFSRERDDAPRARPPSAGRRDTLKNEIQKDQ
jgi:hypothetical protein